MKVLAVGGRGKREFNSLEVSRTRLMRRAPLTTFIPAIPVVNRACATKYQRQNLSSGSCSIRWCLRHSSKKCCIPAIASSSSSNEMFSLR